MPSAALSPITSNIDAPGHRHDASSWGVHGQAMVSSLFLAPALVLYGLFVGVPLLHTVWLSFFHWDGVGPKEFVGLSNYREIVGNGQLAGAFLHAGVLVLVFVAGSIGLALLVVATISRHALRATDARLSYSSAQRLRACRLAGEQGGKFRRRDEFCRLCGGWRSIVETFFKVAHRRYQPAA